MEQWWCGEVVSHELPFGRCFKGIILEQRLSETNETPLYFFRPQRYRNRNKMRELNPIFIIFIVCLFSHNACTDCWSRLVCFCSTSPHTYTIDHLFIILFTVERLWAKVNLGNSVLDTMLANFQMFELVIKLTLLGTSLTNLLLFILRIAHWNKSIDMIFMIEVDKDFWFSFFIFETRRFKVFLILSLFYIVWALVFPLIGSLFSFFFLFWLYGNAIIIFIISCTSFI